LDGRRRARLWKMVGLTAQVSSQTGCSPRLKSRRISCQTFSPSLTRASFGRWAAPALTRDQVDQYHRQLTIDWRSLALTDDVFWPAGGLRVVLRVVLWAALWVAPPSGPVTDEPQQNVKDRQTTAAVDVLTLQTSRMLHQSSPICIPSSTTVWAFDVCSLG
jgi:hypothetical protein